MNKEIRKFKRIVKSRRITQRAKKLTLDRDGLKLPSALHITKKSQKFKPKKFQK